MNMDRVEKKAEVKFKSLREIIKFYFPNANPDYEILKVQMKKVGEERTIEAFRAVFGNWGELPKWLSGKKSVNLLEKNTSGG